MLRIGIIGGGISGLSSYHYLTKTLTSSQFKWINKQHYTIDLYDQNSRSGGWIDTTIIKENKDSSNNQIKQQLPQQSSKIIVERGPRSLRAAGNGKHTLELISDLRLDKQVVFANSTSKTKSLLLDGEITNLPTNSFVKFIKFAIKHKLFLSFFGGKESKIVGQDDESIQSFFGNSFIGKKITSKLIEPICLGIFGGDINRLSVKSCFPSIYNIKKQYKGSLFKGLILSTVFPKKNQQDQQKVVELTGDEVRRVKNILNLDINSTGVFSFQNGLSTLIQSLEKSIPKDNLHLSTKIQSITFNQPKSNNNSKTTYKIIDSNGKSKEFDILISTIPLHSLSKLINGGQQQQLELSNLTSKVEYTNISVINFIIKKESALEDIVKQYGFGYLIPSVEKQPILGVSIDTNTFPHFGGSSGNIILTVMIGGNETIKNTNPSWVNVLEVKSEQNLIDLSKQHLLQYLFKDNQQLFNDSIQSILVNTCKQAIPHYTVDHSDLINSILTTSSQLTNNQNNSNNTNNNNSLSTFVIGGNGLNQGVGINDSIYQSKLLINNLSIYLKGITMT